MEEVTALLLPSWRPFVGRGYSSGLPPREDDWRPERAPWFASVASGRDLVATSCFIAKYTKVVRGYGPLMGQVFVGKLLAAGAVTGGNAALAKPSSIRPLAMHGDEIQADVVPSLGA